MVISWGFHTESGLGRFRSYSFQQGRATNQHQWLAVYLSHRVQCRVPCRPGCHWRFALRERWPHFIWNAVTSIGSSKIDTMDTRYVLQLSKQCDTVEPLAQETIQKCTDFVRMGPRNLTAFSIVLNLARNGVFLLITAGTNCNTEFCMRPVCRTWSWTSYVIMQRLRTHWYCLDRWKQIVRLFLLRFTATKLER